MGISASQLSLFGGGRLGGGRVLCGVDKDAGDAPGEVHCELHECHGGERSINLACLGKSRGGVPAGPLSVLRRSQCSCRSLKELV